MLFSVEYRVSATAKNVRAVSMSLRRFFENVDVTAESASMLELAAAEGMNNVVEHAYEDRDIGNMRICVCFEDTTLKIRIFDEGNALEQEERDSIPMLPDLSDDAPESEDLSCEGRGRFIIASLMDTYEYKLVGNENCLEITKSFA